MFVWNGSDWATWACVCMAMKLQPHLLKNGSHPLVYTNRTLSRGVDLEAAGAIPKQTVVVSCVCAAADVYL